MSRPRRIGVEIHPHILGGTEHFLKLLFGHLDRERFTPVAIASREGRWQDFLDGVAEAEVVPFADAGSQPVDLAGALRRLELDLVQSCYFAPALGLAAMQARIPHVWRMGGHVDAIDRPWSEREKNHLLTLIRLTSRRTVCGSQFLRSQFDSVGSDGVDVIYNGIDLQRFPAPAVAPSEAPPQVAMVAHLLPQKRHEIFLRAARRVVDELPRAHFFVFGGNYGTPELRRYEESLHELVRDLGLGEATTFTELGDERLARIGRMDLVASPGVREGASNAILEAMALGLPVVASRSGGNPELLEDGVSGVLVEPDDAESMAAALIDLLRTPDRRRSLGEAARRRVAAEFDIRQTARRWQQLYEQVLREG